MTIFEKGIALREAYGKAIVELGKNNKNIYVLHSVHKGFIYATNRGAISFTMPQFEQYLKRVYEI